MATPPTQIVAFEGMDNVGGGFYREGLCSPSVILNALVTRNRSLKARSGSAAHITLANAHSLWSGVNASLCVGGTSLYSVDLSAKTTTSLSTTITGPKRRLYYVEIGTCVYISNKYWCGCYEAGAIRTWGAVLDTMDAYTWVTETNGSKYFKADPSGNPTATPKPNELIHKPSPMDYIVEGHGRIWGARAKSVFYSEEGAPEWWNDNENRFDFDDDVRLVAPTIDGLFVGFDDYTVFLSGTNSEEMGRKYLNRGAKEHTLKYTKNFGELGHNVPVWLTPNGIVAGIQGQLLEVTQGKLRYDCGDSVGSDFRIENGEPLYLATVVQPSTVTVADQTTHDWVTEHTDF